MKYYLILFLLTGLLIVACKSHTNSSNSKNSEITLIRDAATIQVLYFHNQRRCATCIAVEDGAVEVVKQLGDTVVVFKSFSIGDPEFAALEKEFDINGQSLLIVGKNQVFDITNMAFLYALPKPDYYRSEIKKQIQKLR